MPSVAVWRPPGGPCWLQHLFWPWTALASAWACALPRLGVFVFCSSKQIQPTFLLGPLPSPLKKVGVVIFLEIFFFPGKKKGPRATFVNKKNQGENRNSLLWFFPDFYGIFLTSMLGQSMGKLRSHPMYGPCSWTFRLGWTVCSHDAWAATVNACSVILLKVPKILVFNKKGTVPPINLYFFKFITQLLVFVSFSSLIGTFLIPSFTRVRLEGEVEWQGELIGSYIDFILGPRPINPGFISPQSSGWSWV